MLSALRVNVYLDGFNLYFGCLEGTPYRWLNVAALCEHLLDPIFPSYVLNRIRYFTAPVQNRPPGAHNRQRAYLRALSTLPNLEIHFGQFRTNARRYPVADESGRPTGLFATVVRSEEKGSDVNLATYLLVDAVDDCYEVALVVSNDTDLVLPIRLVRERFAVAVGVAAPVYFRNRRPMRELEAVADFTAHITRANQSCLRACQFPEELRLPSGNIIRRPEAWAPSASR